MRSVTWAFIEKVKSGGWAIGVTPPLCVADIDARATAQAASLARVDVSVKRNVPWYPLADRNDHL